MAEIESLSLRQTTIAQSLPELFTICFTWSKFRIALETQWFLQDRDDLLLSRSWPSLQSSFRAKNVSSAMAAAVTSRVQENSRSRWSSCRHWFTNEDELSRFELGRRIPVAVAVPPACWRGLQTRWDRAPSQTGRGQTSDARCSDTGV